MRKALCLAVALIVVMMMVVAELNSAPCNTNRQRLSNQQVIQQQPVTGVRVNAPFASVNVQRVSQQQRTIPQTVVAAAGSS